MIETIKQQTPLANNESPQSDSTDNESTHSESQSQISEHSPSTRETFFEKTVQVKHKRRLKRTNQSSISQSTSEIRPRKEEKNFEEETSQNVNLDVLEDLMNVLNNSQLVSDDQTNEANYFDFQEASTSAQIFEAE